MKKNSFFPSIRNNFFGKEQKEYYGSCRKRINKSEKLKYDLERNREQVLKLRNELLEKDKQIASLKVYKNKRDRELKATLRVFDEILRESDGATKQGIAMLEEYENEKKKKTMNKKNRTSNFFYTSLNNKKKKYYLLPESNGNSKALSKNPSKTNINNINNNYNNNNEIEINDNENNNENNENNINNENINNNNNNENNNENNNNENNINNENNNNENNNEINNKSKSTKGKRKNNSSTIKDYEKEYSPEVHKRIHLSKTQRNKIKEILLINSLKEQINERDEIIYEKEEEIKFLRNIDYNGENFKKLYEAHKKSLEEIKTLRNENEILNKKIKIKKTKEIIESKDKDNFLENQINELQENLNNLENENKEKNNKIKLLNEEIKKSNKKIEDLSKKNNNLINSINNEKKKRRKFIERK